MSRFAQQFVCSSCANLMRTGEKHKEMSVQIDCAQGKVANLTPRTRRMCAAIVVCCIVVVIQKGSDDRIVKSVDNQVCWLMSDVLLPLIPRVVSRPPFGGDLSRTSPPKPGL